MTALNIHEYVTADAHKKFSYTNIYYMWQTYIGTCVIKQFNSTTVYKSKVLPQPHGLHPHIAIMFGTEKLEWWGYSIVEKVYWF